MRNLLTPTCQVQGQEPDDARSTEVYFQTYTGKISNLSRYFPTVFREINNSTRDSGAKRLELYFMIVGGRAW